MWIKLSTAGLIASCTCWPWINCHLLNRTQEISINNTVLTNVIISWLSYDSSIHCCLRNRLLYCAVYSMQPSEYQHEIKHISNLSMKLSEFYKVADHSVHKTDNVRPLPSVNVEDKKIWRPTLEKCLTTILPVPSFQYGSHWLHPFISITWSR